jgi:hypothetical protein
VKVTGNPVAVALNRRYLVNALRFGLNEVEVEDPLSPVIFSNGGKKLVIMPINLDGPARIQVSPQPQTNSEATTTPAEKQNQPSAPPEAQTEERKEMPRTVAARATTPEPMTTFQPADTATANNNGNNNGNGNGSAVKSLVEHVEQIKDNLKNVIRDLNNVIDAVKLADKERKSSEKEIESIRSKLRQIQSAAI